MTERENVSSIFLMKMSPESICLMSSSHVVIRANQENAPGRKTEQRRDAESQNMKGAIKQKIFP